MSRETEVKKQMSLGKTKSLIIKLMFLIIMLIVWEVTAKSKVFGPSSELIFPSLDSIFMAFFNNFVKGYAGISFWVYILNSMKLLAEGLFIGVALSFLLSGVAIINKAFYAVYDLLVAIFDLLPGVALLPVVIIIVGIKPGVIVFLVIHAVIWPMSRNLLDGFKAVPRIYVEAGLNIGLKKMSLLLGVYLPASAAYILSGIKVAWARAWRGLISAEMIFGIASVPGIGLFINQMRANMKNAEMYATLIVIIIIGVVVQYGILEPIENKTVKKWGMSR
jgi:NitT/TauT family transport system permease protein